MKNIIKTLILLINNWGLLFAQVQFPCTNNDNISCNSYFIPSNCTCNLMMIANDKGQKNCCCGRDYFFYSFPYADKETIGFVGAQYGNVTGNNSECERTTFCDRKDYVQSHLPNGLYFLQFHFTNGMMMVKNVVKVE